MALQFGLFDYIIIAVFYALAATVLLFAWLWLRRWRHWRAVLIPVALVALIAPWADEVWIAWRFGQLCKDAGVHVYRTVEVDGFYDSTMRSGYELIKRHGYKYMEHPSDPRTKVDYVERIDGEWKKTTLDRPRSRYIYQFADPRQEVPAGFKIEKTEWQVVDSQNGEIIGRETRFSRYPGWVQSLWIKYFGNGGNTCEGAAPQPPTLRHLLYHYVVIPKRTEGK